MIDGIGEKNQKSKKFIKEKNIGRVEAKPADVLTPSLYDNGLLNPLLALFIWKKIDEKNIIKVEIIYFENEIPPVKTPIKPNKNAIKNATYNSKVEPKI
jgi:hypothetical protein